MSSPSFVDFLAEKLSSFSSKMRDDSFQHFGTSFLMSGGNNSTHQWDPLKINILKENCVFDSEGTNPFSPNILLNQVLGLLDSNHNLKFYHNLEKPEYIFSHSKNRLFSPHLLNLISSLNSYRVRSTTRPDMSLIPSGSIFLGNTINSFLNESLEMEKISIADVKKTCSSPVRELTMSVNVSHLPTEKIDVTDKKCFLSTNVKLDVKLANRKTKQMNKRSKKRRRRQKKSQQCNLGNSVSFSDDEDVAVHNCPSPVSNEVCFIAESPDFECSISFQHTVQMPSCVSSFVIPVESDTNDDSEWESYDESDSLMPNGEVLSSSNSSPTKSESTESWCSSPEGCVNLTSSIVSFVVPVGDSSDDDSEWDSCEPSTFAETSEFEFTGLFLTNLCTTQIPPCILTVTSEDETEESLQMKKVLLEVNKSWNDLMKGDDTKPKSTSKVTFVPDEDLVEIFSVEIYERKGEWEIYATERLRFKRKIDELEKILSPYLNPGHRSKVLKKLMESEL